MLRVVLRLAKEQLEKGGFIPFGAALGMKRDVPRRMPKSMKKDVKQDKLDTIETGNRRDDRTFGDL